MWTFSNLMFGEFQLGNAAISQRNIQRNINFKIIRNGEFDSDHYLSKIKLKLSTNKVLKITKSIKV